MRGLGNILLFCLYGILAITLSVPTIGLTLLFFIANCCFIFWGAPNRRETLIKKIESNLTADETLVAEVVELRPFALFHRRFGIAVTNNRIMSLQRKILGGYKKMEEWQWKYISEVSIEENNFPSILGSNLFFSFTDSPNHDPGFDIIGVDSQVASKIYAVANAQKQDWTEKNRIRMMEEHRAKSGGVNIQGFPSATPMPTVSLIEQKLKEAKSLLDSGLISNSEYQERKSKILSDHI
ncbi:hypothetical protein Gdia_2736 [Gluconacetobacter diazotrophicus PA1 5]|uniref:SHOCT domain-containing protein n=1 Tax=Gluconacetobacter diazotrophicus TaxID=33996 RepID=UPI000173B70D|nr:SHOCT domain-containing protein [Gluconacetobacter diazotrophicus]ACI52472.1 hypothetical protein Gdia_2736 [Gluconacetobacter diazotrophicus PA1 5]TWA97883.1 putative oligomerization/nucleic acid binding protein [Gluconacetobacter diazotrophicus]